MVSKENKRILVTLTKEEVEQIEILAKQEKRSISNFSAKIISDYLENLDKSHK